MNVTMPLQADELRPGDVLPGWFGGAIVTEVTVNPPVVALRVQTPTGSLYDIGLHQDRPVPATVAVGRTETAACAHCSNVFTAAEWRLAADGIDSGVRPVVIATHADGRKVWAHDGCHDDARNRG